MRALGEIDLIIMFRSLFKGRSSGEGENFRDRVLEIVGQAFPGIQAEVLEQNEEVIVVRGTQIGLQNLRTKYDQSDRSQKTLEELVVDHFQLALRDEPPPLDYAAVRLQLRPQIMPPDYAQQAPIVSFPFGRSLAVGIVINLEDSYSYLKREDALRWEKSERDLLDIAIANLDEASGKLPMQASEGEEARWVGIETKDGFDAARILIPELREFLAARLGSPFRFGVPNRDFLICWNQSASRKFSDFTAEKLREDFETQPYALSPHVFEVTHDGAIVELA